MADHRSPIEQLTSQSDAEQIAFCGTLSVPQLVEMFESPDLRAHGGQVPPPGGDWTTWLILAGRGFGKTFAGARWVDERARSVPGAHIGIIAASLVEARNTMVEGASGILRTAAVPPVYEPSLRRLRWTNGSTATLFGAAEPDSLRGANFDFAWGDEIAKWSAAEAALDNLALALRVGPRPRSVLTTTPRPLKWLQALAVADGVAVTRGRTHDNAFNLAPSFVSTLMARYGGTRLGRQELQGEFVVDLDGALWTHDLLDGGRVADAPPFGRTVIGVDPPAGEGGKADACGIVVVRLGPDGRGYVVADRSVQGRSPEGWARAVAAASAEFTADRIVAEINNGGAMVVAVLRAVDCNLPVKTVFAAAGKVARAEPVAALYETGRVVHVGALAALEDELCGLLTGGGYAGPGRSPDRADALVWALTELLLGTIRVPSIRVL